MMTDKILFKVELRTTKIFWKVYNNLSKIDSYKVEIYLEKKNTPRTNISSFQQNSEQNFTSLYKTCCEVNKNWTLNIFFKKPAAFET